MAIDFPNSPTVGQIYTVGDKSWIWDGTVWKAYGASLSPTVLKVDSTNTRVGINNQSPAYTLDVNGTVEATQFLQGSDYLTPYTGFRNAIINGDFRINQRAWSSSTASASYGFDRFSQINSGGTVTMSSQSFTVGSPAATGYEATNFCRMVTASQSATSNYAILRQHIEDVRTFANSTVTVSFWAKASSGTPKVAVEFVQQFGTGGSPSADVNTYIAQVTLSTSWARYSVTGTVPNINGKTIGTTANTSALVAHLWVSAGSDFNSRTGSIGIQNNTFDFWGVQVERGSVATPFEQRPIGTELALCQRYYWRIIGNASNKKRIPSCGSGYSSGGSWQGQIFIPVTMRIAPTALEWSSVGFTDNVSFDSTAFVTLTIPAESSGDCPIVNGTGASSGAAYTGVNLILIGGSSYFALSSEF